MSATPLQTTAAPLPNGGNCAMQGCDTLATRRQRALHGAKPPPPPVSSALQGPRVRLGRRWVAEARQLHTRKVPRRNKTLPTRTTPRRFGTNLSQHTPRTACAVQNSPRTPLPTACAGQNSPCSPEMAQFGAFSECRESFVPFSPPRSRAGRILYRTQGRDGASHDSTTGPTCVEGGDRAWSRQISHAIQKHK